MNQMQEEYLKTERWLKLRHGGAFVTVDGVYVMLNGQPFGENGLKWWVYKVVNAMGYRKKKEEEKSEKAEDAEISLYLEVRRR